MSGLSRFLYVLRCFDETKPNWTVQELAERLSAPTSTTYRTVRELVAHGLLEPSTEAHYRLGSAFVEFDRMIRLTDPLVKVGIPLLRDLVAEVRFPCVAVLARLYGDRVICAVDERYEGDDLLTSYERGRPMPLTRGATSKAILAQLPARRLRKLLQTEPEIGALDQQSFHAELTAIRKRGFCVTQGEVDRDLRGIAVPVSSPDLAISASISLIVRAGSVSEATERRFVLLLVSAANLLTGALHGEPSAA
ncbi:IclR family transcriptional regulator [Rhizobiaceae sp. 2RAB30]